VTAESVPGRAPIDGRTFRNIVGTFGTGVTVITMPTPTGAWGMTANSFTSVSLDPLLVLVCVDKSTRTLDYMQEAGVWAVNILGEDQETISRTFATKDASEERTMVGTTYHRGVTGSPLIDGAVAYIECRTWASYEGGDHVIILGEVQAAEVTRPEGQPLLFFRGRYGQLERPTT
jgi:flavin reductase